MIVTITECLKRLEYEESTKIPSQRRTVPTQTDIARAANMKRQAVSASIRNMEENLDSQINRRLLDVIVRELRSNGFEIELNDIIRFVDEANKPEKT